MKVGRWGGEGIGADEVFEVPGSRFQKSERCSRYMSGDDSMRQLSSCSCRSPGAATTVMQMGVVGLQNRDLNQEEERPRERFDACVHGRYSVGIRLDLSHLQKMQCPHDAPRGWADVEISNLV